MIGFYPGFISPQSTVYGLWDSSFKSSGLTLSNGNATVTSNDAAQSILATAPILQPSYWEINCDTKGTGNHIYGVVFQSQRLSQSGISATNPSGVTYNMNGSDTAPLNVSFTTGDRIGLAFKPATGELWVNKNGSWLGNDTTGAAARTILKAVSRVYYPYFSTTNSGAVATLITIPGLLNVSPPSGFSALSVQPKPSWYWHTTDKGANLTLSENNTKVTKSSTGHNNIRIGIESLSGKQVWAVQLTADGVGSTAKCVGIMDNDDSLTVLIGGNGFGMGYRSGGTVVRNSTTLQTYSSWGSVNDIIMVATDNSARKLWFGLNGSWNGDPGAGTGDVGTGWATDGTTEQYAYLACGMTDSGDAFKLIPWPYSIPSGFTAPTIAT